VHVLAESDRQGTVLLGLTLVVTFGRDGVPVGLGVGEFGMARVAVAVAPIGVCVGRTVWVKRAVTVRACVVVGVGEKGGRNSVGVGVAVSNAGVPVRVGVGMTPGVPVAVAGTVDALVGVAVTSIAVVGVTVMSSVGVAVKSANGGVAVGEGVSEGAVVDVSLGVAAGAIGVAVALASGAAAQIVKPSKTSQLSLSKA
jgi:hypothetical protein